MNQNQNPVFIKDINGDKKADFIRFYDNEILVLFSEGKDPLAHNFSISSSKLVKISGYPDQ